MKLSGQEMSENRAPNHELSIEARRSIISRVEGGAQQKELAAEFGVHRNTISRTIKRWKENGTVASLPRNGRPPLFTHRDRRYLVQQVRKYPKTQYRQLLETARLINPHAPSKSTIYRALNAQRLTNHRAASQPRADTGHAISHIKKTKVAKPKHHKPKKTRKGRGA